MAPELVCVPGSRKTIDYNNTGHALDDDLGILADVFDRSRIMAVVSIDDVDDLVDFVAVQAAQHSAKIALIDRPRRVDFHKNEIRERHDPIARLRKLGRSVEDLACPILVG
jgi:hypothetical protein